MLTRPRIINSLVRRGTGAPPVIGGSPESRFGPKDATPTNPAPKSHDPDQWLMASGDIGVSRRVYEQKEDQASTYQGEFRVRGFDPAAKNETKQYSHQHCHNHGRPGKPWRKTYNIHELGLS